MPSASTRIIPLGGLGEVGKNMTVVESNGGLVLIDAGMSFPRDEHLGVDLILPDFGYLRDRRNDIRAVVLTHGHEDHVGALPFLLREIPVPEVWATRLTLGLVQSKLDEHGVLRSAELIEAVPEKGPAQVGPFRAEFVRMAHSIPDSVAVVLETPGGRIVHTGDYKIDHTPIDGFRTDVGRLADLGNEGVDLVLGDSTNAERPGVTASERMIGEAFRQIIPQRRGRVLVASFASNVHRVQQAIDVALETGRKVALVGRSLRRNVNIARNLGYIDVPDNLLVKADDLVELAPADTMILCAGSQGEPMSALTRIAYRNHPAVAVEAGDLIIISAKPVPGNELRVHDTINGLTRSGAEVLHHEIAPVHASGHGHADEIRTVLALLRPRNVMPVHGEFRMLAAQGRLAEDVGVPADRIVLAENGSVVELADGRARITGEVEAGMTFVDGLAVGDVNAVALRDRRHLSEDGVLIVVATVGTQNGRELSPPEVIARGFAEPGPVLDEARDEAERALERSLGENVGELKLLQEEIHDAVGRLVYERTGRRPMILPVVLEV
jgi:ribonuclease J